MRLEGKRGKKGKVSERKRGIVAKTGFANLDGFESKTVMNSECSIGQFDSHVVKDFFPILSEWKESRNSKRTSLIVTPQLSPISMLFRLGRLERWRVETVGSQRLLSPMVRVSMVRGEGMMERVAIIG